MARYIVKRRPTGKWSVTDDRMRRDVERHATEEEARKSAMRLNGLCLHCGKPLAECKVENPRDEAFGSEFDSDDLDD